MSLLETTLVALRALERHKLRSFLTALGMIIGVGAVIAMTSIGAGARERVERMFEDMGSNMLVVRSGSTRMGGARGGAGTQPTLTWDDLRAIEEELPAVRFVAPLLAMGAQVMAEGENWSTAVQGTTPEYFMIRNWAVARGHAFTHAELDGAARVAVLGLTVVEKLFGPYADPLGQVIRVNRVPFQVIGVAAARGQSAFGSDQDDVVFVPVTTYRSRLQGGLQQFLDGSIFVTALSRQATGEAQAQIESVLRERHRLRSGDPDDFTVRNLADLAEAQEEGARTMTSLLAGIALVSLVVGGIGIMNIMLVSVTERTREIGLRMAVGARPRSILLQFLVESVVLSVVGGLLGVAAGLGTALTLVRRFAWPMLVEPGIVPLALAVSLLVGVGFGLYPATRAARLDPIQALRSE
jgi:putative ABC transport system permease protein